MRATVAMLPSRELGVGSAGRALGGEAAKLEKRIAKLRKYEGDDKKAKIAEIGNQAKRLGESRAFLEDLEAKKHQYRVDYVKERAGLEGEIDTLATPKALEAAVSGEGYVILGMTGDKAGHAMALYRDRDGVRFYDPNYGEVFFEDRAQLRVLRNEFVEVYSRGLLGTLKDIEIADFKSSVMPTSPEDAELADHGYVPLNLTFPEIRAAQAKPIIEVNINQ
jgi:hypothetical protein